jgi:hypothetical protein
MATSCEALAYADLSGLISIHKDPLFAEKLGYVLLDVAGRSILELLAFCTVTAIWLKTAIESSPAVLWGSQSTPFGILPTIFLITFFFLVFASASLSVMELVLYQDKSLADIERLPWGRAQIILEAVAWGVHSLVVLECLIVTSKRVLNLVPTLEWPKRLSLLSKAVLPMAVASIVYAVRCIWLLAIVWHRESIDRGTWIWWIGFAWVPTWLAVGFLLYSARKRDSTLDTQLEEPLLPARRPPAEAFMAFSRHRHGMDADDSFSVSRSPVKTISATMTENVVVADDEETTTLGRGTVIDGITNEL